LAYPGNTFINISIGCKHHLYVSFLFKCAWWPNFALLLN
jgi:hypothetical protein